MNQKEMFLNLFVELEKALKDELNDPTLTTSQSLIAMKNRPGHNIIKQYSEELDAIRSMRNIFAHERGGKAYELIVPTPKAIAMLQHIVDALKQPMTVADLLKSQSKKTYWFQDTQAFNDVLDSIERYHVDKFPVFKDNQFVNVLTRNGIVNWLVKHRNQEVLDRVKIKEVLPFEQPMPYSVVSHTTRLFEVLDTFEQAKPPKMLLISKRPDGLLTGQKDLVGVITAADLPRVLLLLSNNEK